MIETQNLTKIYQINSLMFVALNNVNLTIEDGEFAVIIGPSGAGKTTLLNLVGLIDKPTSGDVLLDGVKTALLSEKERREIRLLKIGFIFQTINLLPQLTAIENVEIPMALMKLPSDKQRKRAIKLLESVGLGDKANRLPRQLSVGEMRRVAIARALANDPKIILADEPTGDLDLKTGMEIINLLHSIHEKSGRTVVVATHDKSIVKAADRVYFMRNGRIKLLRGRV
ncbi:MAG: ABC transporter ATP-binding protein [Candidatus Bathyarchaeia archaeon]